MNGSKVNKLKMAMLLIKMEICIIVDNKIIVLSITVIIIVTTIVEIMESKYLIEIHSCDINNILYLYS